MHIAHTSYTSMRPHKILSYYYYLNERDFCPTWDFSWVSQNCPGLDIPHFLNLGMAQRNFQRTRNKGGISGILMSKIKNGEQITVRHFKLTDAITVSIIYGVFFKFHNHLWVEIISNLIKILIGQN